MAPIVKKMLHDHTKYNKLTIEGTTYHGENLLKLCHSRLVKSGLSNWETELYQFIIQWLQADRRITVKTSGSTGTPKNLEVQKSAMLQSAFNTLDFFGLKSHMSALLCLPCQYIAGKMMVVRAFAGGLNLIPVPVNAHPLEKLNHPVNFAALTPFQMTKELQATPIRTSLLRTIILGGSPTDNQLSEKLQNQTFKAWETYGMTETLSHIALRPINGAQANPLFTPLKNISLSTNSRGCLIIEAPGIQKEPIITNDLVDLQENGKFRIKGRIDNMINSGGLKISPEEIEAQITPLINQPFYISSRPHPSLGQELVLVMENKPYNSIALLEKIKGIVHTHHAPRKIVIKNPIPRTATGKIKRE